MPPPPPVVPVGAASTLANHYIAPAPVPEPSPKQTKKTKKQKKSVTLRLVIGVLAHAKSRNDGSSTSKSFPTPYHFTSNDDSDALARRAARFQQSAPTQNTQSGISLGGWFADDGASGSGGGLGMVPGQVGRGKMKGKGVFGYGADEVMEVDPVSFLALHTTREPADIAQNVIDWDKHTIRGTNTKLEKSYLRLTSVSFSCSAPYRLCVLIPQEPSPADIRPLHILKETLQLLKRKWKEKHNYAYALDQFKSMRQDLTVGDYQLPSGDIDLRSTGAADKE